MSSNLKFKFNKNSIGLISVLGLAVVLVAGAQAHYGSSLNASFSADENHDSVSGGTLIADLPDLDMADSEEGSNNNEDTNSDTADEAKDNQANLTVTTDTPSDPTDSDPVVEEQKVKIELDGEGDANVSEDNGQISADFSNNGTLDGDRNENTLDYDRDTDTNVDNNIKLDNDNQDVKLITGNNKIKDNKNPITVKPSSVNWNLNYND
ncbi:hypothetical protein KC644_00805 [Candidatus Berkelbacteria bacterium]|nr:hypothetical protein [Candidatus Berkelbacteria bacterium]